MKRTIYFRTDKGTTGEIRLDSDKYTVMNTHATIIFYGKFNGKEPLIGHVYKNQKNKQALNINLESPIEIEGKKYRILIIQDQKAREEFLEADKLLYMAYKWGQQNKLSEEDKENLSRPMYYYYDGWEFEAKMDTKIVESHIRKYAIDNDVDYLIDWYFLKQAFYKNENLRQRALSKGEPMGNGYNKIELTHDDVVMVIEEFQKNEAERRSDEGAKRREEDLRNLSIRKAKESGEPQVLHKVFSECNDPDEDCDLDVITTYIDGEGNTEVHRQHTW